MNFRFIGKMESDDIVENEPETSMLEFNTVKLYVAEYVLPFFAVAVIFT